MTGSSSNRIVVRQHGSFGRSAYAAHAIKAGELVVCEYPLLYYSLGSFDASLTQLLQLVQQQLQAPEHAASSSACDEASWQQACVELLAFCRAPTDTQKKVLNNMFNTPQGPGSCESAPVCRTGLQARLIASLADAVKDLLCAEGSWREGSLAAKVLGSADEMQRLLLSFELNAHMADDG